MAIRQIGVHVIFCHGPNDSHGFSPDPAQSVAPPHPICEPANGARNEAKTVAPLAEQSCCCKVDSVKAFSCPRGEPPVVGKNVNGESEAFGVSGQKYGGVTLFGEDPIYSQFFISVGIDF